MRHRFVLITLFLLGSSTLPAHAQMWGSGMWGGMQGCAQPMGGGARPMSMGSGSANSSEVLKAQSALSESERKLKEKKRALQRAERDLDRLRSDVVSSLDDDAGDKILSHIDEERSCSGDSEETASCNSASCASPFRVNEWAAICASDRKGRINTQAACARGSDARACSTALGQYPRKSAETRKLRREVTRLESEVERGQDDVRDARENASSSMSGNTEGSPCLECMAGTQRQTDWGGVAANLGVGLLATYMGQQQNKMIVQQNSALGWPTQNLPSSWSYGFPYLANGLYGAMGGQSQNSFGCGSQMNMGGAFGYPMGMNAMGGGMMGGYGMMGYGSMGYGSMGMMNSPMMMNPYGMMNFSNGGMYGMYGLNGMNSLYGMGNWMGLSGTSTLGTGYGTTYGYGVPPALSGSTTTTFGTSLTGR